MDIQKLRTLIAVAEAGNLTRASKNINMTPSGVTRQMKAMEKELGMTLFHGVPTGVQMTEEGQSVAKLATTICDLFDQRIADIKAMKDAAEGDLKVIVSNTLMFWLKNHLKEFRSLHPGIKLKLVADEKKSLHLATSLSGVFIGFVGAVPPANSAFIWQEIDACTWNHYAHKDYLEAYGTPTSFADLDEGHHIIQYAWAPEYFWAAGQPNSATRESNPLLYEERPPKEPREHALSTDDVLCCQQMIESGSGIGTLPDALAKNESLVKILDKAPRKMKELEIKYYLVYPSHLRENRRIKVFKEFVLQKWHQDKEPLLGRGKD